MTLLMLLMVLAVITLPSIVWLYALADATINNFKSLGVKIIWILALCFFPPVGTVLYYLIGRNQRRTYYSVGRFVLICILIFPIVMTVAYYMHSPEPNSYMEPSAPSTSKTIQISMPDNIGQFDKIIQIDKAGNYLVRIKSVGSSNLIKEYVDILRKNRITADFTNYSYTIELWAINCKQVAYDERSSTYYDKNGRKIYSAKTADAPLEPVPPDSKAASAITSVCKFVAKINNMR